MNEWVDEGIGGLIRWITVWKDTWVDERMTM